MIQIQPSDFVVIKETGEVGEVVEIFTDPDHYSVRARGVYYTCSPDDILRLTTEQVAILNQSLAMVAKIIDVYRPEELYDPVRDPEGEILYSSPAAAVFRALGFPRLIVEMGNLSEKVATLAHDLSEAREQG